MLSLQGIICKQLKIQGKLAEKFEDLACDPKITFPHDTIPTMTSSTEPYGTCDGSNGYNYYLAFSDTATATGVSRSKQGYNLFAIYRYADVQEPGTYKATYGTYRYSHDMKYTNNSAKTVRVRVKDLSGTWHEIWNYSQATDATTSVSSGEIQIKYEFKAIEFYATRRDTSSYGQVTLTGCQLTRLA